MNEPKKAWAISLGLIFSIIAVSFGIAYYAVPDDQKPPIIVVDNDTKPIVIDNDTKPKPENETKPNPPKPDNNETKPLPPKPKPLIVIDDDDDPKIIINDTGVFIFNFTENTTLKG